MNRGPDVLLLFDSSKLYPCPFNVSSLAPRQATSQDISKVLTAKLDMFSTFSIRYRLFCISVWAFAGTLLMDAHCINIRLTRQKFSSTKQIMIDKSTLLVLFTNKYLSVAGIDKQYESKLDIHDIASTFWDKLLPNGLMCRICVLHHLIIINNNNNNISNSKLQT